MLNSDESRNERSYMFVEGSGRYKLSYVESSRVLRALQCSSVQLEGRKAYGTCDFRDVNQMNANLASASGGNEWLMSATPR